MEFGARDTPKDYEDTVHHQVPTSSETSFQGGSQETVIAPPSRSALSELAVRGSGVVYESPQADPEAGELPTTDPEQSVVPEDVSPPHEAESSAAAVLLARPGRKSVARHELHMLDTTLREAGINMGDVLSESHKAMLPELLSDKSLLQIAREQGRGVAAVSTQTQAIVRRLALHPLTTKYMPPRIAEMFDTPVLNTPAHPYAGAIREAKAADAAAHGSLPHWGRGQPARILRALHERGFDILARIPTAQTPQREIIRLTLAGYAPSQIAKQAGVSTTRISQLTANVADIIRYIVPRDELPIGLPADFLTPAGSIPAQAVSDERRIVDHIDTPEAAREE